MKLEEAFNDLKKHAAFLSPKQRKLLIEKGIDAYDEVLGSIQAQNVFLPKYDWERRDLFKTLTRLWSDPSNLYLTCKHIFNVQLAPMQIVSLDAMLKHKYPMLIASRGYGKCITGDSFVCTNKGFVRIGDLVGEASVREPVYMSNTQLLGDKRWNEVEYGWNNGFTDTIRIETIQGYTLEGIPEHRIQVLRDGEIQWSELQHVRSTDIVPIDRSTEWPKEAADFPEDLAYAFGLLVGNGEYTVRGIISFTSQDEELHQAIQEIMPKYFHKQFSSRMHHGVTSNLYGVDIWDRFFQEFGFNSPVCGEKDVPASILSARPQAVAAFLSGLFDTDGCVYKNHTIGFCSKSQKLAKSVQFLLSRFGIICRVKKRLNSKYQRYYYHIGICGKHAKLFKEKINFRLPRKRKLLDVYNTINLNTNLDVIPTQLLTKYIRKLRACSYFSSSKNISYEKLQRLVNLRKQEFPAETQEIQAIIDRNFYFDNIRSITKSQNQTFDVHLKDNHEFVSNGFISHNSFLLALYIMYVMLFDQGARVVVAGSGLRQAKVIFGYIEKIWSKAYVLQELTGCAKPLLGVNDCQFAIGDSRALGLPIGDGEKIRGQRSNYLIIDEFKSLSEIIYQQVLEPFGSVSAEPVKKMMHKAAEELLLAMGYPIEKLEDMGNRQVISGTPDYDFNHFSKYHKRYKAIINSRGDEEKLKEIFNGPPPPGFNWRNFCILRIPVELIPSGFMDEENVARAKATSSAHLYASEYGACFIKDSNGFYPRSLIESCTANSKNQISTPSLSNIVFEAVIQGSRDKEYAFGVDAAAQRDNFAIVIVELWPDHRRIVYCWTLTKKRYMEEFKQGDDDFYTYCAKHILKLKKTFPTKCIALDAQGGGRTIIELLHNINILEEGQLPLWEVKDPKKEKVTDRYVGEHILHVIEPSNADWVYNANHSLKHDMASKALLFPSQAASEITLAIAYEAKLNTDALETVLYEINELKDEITMIEHSKSANGRDRWSAPEIKMPNTGKKGHLTDDRFWALLLANTEGRDLNPRKFEVQKFESAGYHVLENLEPINESNLVHPHDWFNDNIGGILV